MPDGWKYETSAPDRVDMVWQNNNGAFLIILLTAPQSSSGDPDKDFALAWRALVETDPRMALPSPIYDVRGSVGYAATWSGGSVANLLAEESEIGLVDQGGGLQDMARRFTAKSCRRTATQFLWTTATRVRHAPRGRRRPTRAAISLRRGRNRSGRPQRRDLWPPGSQVNGALRSPRASDNGPSKRRKRPRRVR